MSAKTLHTIFHIQDVPLHPQRYLLHSFQCNSLHKWLKLKQKCYSCFQLQLYFLLHIWGIPNFWA
jgi:hypothetical protein